MEANTEMKVIQPDVITQELTKNNITESILQEMEQNFLPLTINGVADKEGYAAVNSARISCKKLRVMTTKICKSGREEAISIQKGWIQKEKEVVARIQKIEDHLSEQEKIIDDEKERVKREKEEAEQKRLHERVALLTGKGMSFNGVGYGLNDLKITAVRTKLMDEFSFNGFVAELEVEYQKEQVRLAAIEAEKKAESERQAQVKANQEAKEKELADREAALKAEQDKIAADKLVAEKAAQEREAKIRAEQEIIAKETRDAEERRWKTRFAQLPSVNLSSDGVSVIYSGATVISIVELTQMSDEAFLKIQALLTNKVNQDKEDKEQERLAQVKAAEEAAAQKAKEESEAKAKADLEAKIKQEQQAKADQERVAALAPDRDKVKSIATALSKIEVPTAVTAEGIAAMTEIQLQITKFVFYVENKANQLN